MKEGRKGGSWAKKTTKKRPSLDQYTTTRALRNHSLKFAKVRRQLCLAMCHLPCSQIHPPTATVDAPQPGKGRNEKTAASLASALTSGHLWSSQFSLQSAI